MRQITYGIETTLETTFDDALAQTRAALKSEGFGVLTEIDVRATIREKLGIDFEPYVILGACNPQLAHRGLTAEHDLGLLLPCNVIVHQHGEHAVVAAADPEAMLGIVANSAVREVATEAKERLERAIRFLGGHEADVGSSGLRADPPGER